jgi:protein arginine N-methyltransferase 5
MPVAGNQDSLYIGWEPPIVPNIDKALSECHKLNFDFLVTPLVHPRNERSSEDTQRSSEPLTRSDLLLDSTAWTTMIVGTVSSWIDLDSPSAPMRELSKSALIEEVNLAAHLGVYATLLPAIGPGPNTQYAMLLSRFTIGNSCSKMWLRVPTTLGPDAQDAWPTWHHLRSVVGATRNLDVVLELTSALPEARPLARWKAEPVKAVIVSTDICLTNAKGYPVLPKRHKEFLLEMMKHKVQVLIQGHSDEVGALVNYVAQVYQTLPVFTQAEKFELSYRDFLQAPLQPLSDNLESQTYETFERDPVKYVQYEEAVYRCLMDKLAAGREGSSIVIMVVGAGRGPLVEASLNASRRAKVKPRMWAVEKNPNAIITLRSRKVRDKWENVEIVSSDMRTWETTERADIMVSELLGSFGDNELSPECLDGAQRFLQKDGVSIPQHYWSSMEPIAATKLWKDVKEFDDLSHAETVYLTALHGVYRPSSPQKVFAYSHPNWELSSNDRHIDVEFDVEDDCVIHGLAGYFHCDLYKDVVISIHPPTFSTGMFSWFPVFIPLRAPIFVKKGEKMAVSMWRLSNPAKVWYEWAVTQPTPQSLMNPCGRSYAMWLK